MCKAVKYMHKNASLLRHLPMSLRWRRGVVQSGVIKYCSLTFVDRYLIFVEMGEEIVIFVDDALPAPAHQRGLTT
jgi:hypothetical protein